MKGPVGGISEPLKVLGGSYLLPKDWLTNVEPGVVINDKTEDLLDMVSSYDGVGQWYVSHNNDGIAIVLIHDNGARNYIVATRYCYGAGG